MGSPCEIHSGLEIGPGLALRTRELLDGSWVAWIEQDGRPLEDGYGEPRSFHKPSCYQAQCAAARWLRSLA